MLYDISVWTFICDSSEGKMKLFIIAVCIALIAAAVVLLIRGIIRIKRGESPCKDCRSCGGCNGCPKSEACKRTDKSDEKKK